MYIHADRRAVVLALLLVPVFLISSAAGQGRFKLRDLYPQEKIAKVLIPQGQWRPVAHLERPQSLGESARVGAEGPHRQR